MAEETPDHGSSVSRGQWFSGTAVLAFEVLETNKVSLWLGADSKL